VVQDFEDRLRQSARHLAGQAAGLQTHVLPLQAGKRFLAGNAVMRLENKLVRISSGLLVPESAVRPAQPIDQILTYLDAEEMFGQPVPPEAAARMVSVLSVEQTVAWAAHWLAKLGRPGAARRDVDSEFAPHRCVGRP
jgi:hypothetical protein